MCSLANIGGCLNEVGLQGLVVLGTLILATATTVVQQICGCRRNAKRRKKAKSHKLGGQGLEPPG